ncbi:polysaccharide pyruvyl transferase family protein [Brevundimonas naejangsanensis]|jgi:polysaccharide pyruvyl transferase WcaK-like protein|uniref:polysaccharide pyruvyl transferase family protein n=1 Tax=Brevundimonas naejangsanensis TaxID=588932 RepID=UPI003D004E77
MSQILSVSEISEKISQTRDISSKDGLIRSVYNFLLLRDPSREEIDLRDESPLADLVKSVMGSKEFRLILRNGFNFNILSSTKKRIVLFGAYGNGNIGDAIQALSIARHLKVVRPEAEVWSYSELPGRYEFQYDRVLPQGLFLRGAGLNQFDALIVGGGGLLSHPHAPLFDETWQTTTNLPVIVLGAGAIGPVAARSKTMLDKAVFVSGRDDASLAALQAIRDDAHSIADPVLCDPHYIGGSDVGTGRLFILKKAEDAEYEAVKRIYRKGIDSVCFIEPAIDFDLTAHFPEAYMLTSVDDMIAMIDAHSDVVSTRYHGCILALLRGKKVVGIREQKTQELLTKYGLAQNFFTSFAHVKDIDDLPQSDVRELVAQDRATFLSGLDTALRAAQL